MANRFKPYPKGQTKSKYFFKPTFPPKNEQMNSILPLWYLFLFVFWRKLKTSERHFEINWPLGDQIHVIGFPPFAKRAFIFSHPPLNPFECSISILYWNKSWIEIISAGALFFLHYIGTPDGRGIIKLYLIEKGKKIVKTQIKIIENKTSNSNITST